jgi:glycosyltransferase involved in cell wall biosynthesis
VARLAFVSPLPPAATDIADYAAEVLELLAARHVVEAFHDQEALDTARLPARVRGRPARELAARHRERAYDAIVYQMGNGTAHAFLYPLLAHLPGLMVLHDLVLHHSRARTFFDSDEARAYAADPASSERRTAAQLRLTQYRAELAYCYPDAAVRLAEAQLSTVGKLLPYAYPLFRLPVEASRMVAVHNAFMAEAVRAEVPEACVSLIPHQAKRRPVSAADIAALRGQLGIEAQDLVVGAFGQLTPEKRIGSLARAVARCAADLPRLRLLLVGPVPEPAALERLLAELGIAGRTVVTGCVPFDSLPVHMEAADLVVHLRYPTARETSGALLRVLAQGRPTMVSDLEHQAEIPEDAVLRLDVRDEEGELTRALLRLGRRPSLRERLGRRAAEYVAHAHSPARTAEAYEAAIEETRRRPDPAPRAWPAHWLA